MVFLLKCIFINQCCHVERKREVEVLKIISNQLPWAEKTAWCSNGNSSCASHLRMLYQTKVHFRGDQGALLPHTMGPCHALRQLYPKGPSLLANHLLWMIQKTSWQLSWTGSRIPSLSHSTISVHMQATLQQRRIVSPLTWYLQIITTVPERNSSTRLQTWQYLASFHRFIYPKFSNHSLIMIG